MLWVTDKRIVRHSAKHSDVLWERHLVSGAYFLTYNFSGRYWPWSYIFSQWKYVVSLERALTFIRRDFWTFLWVSCVFSSCIHQKDCGSFNKARKTLLNQCHNCIVQKQTKKHYIIYRRCNLLYNYGEVFLKYYV